jgi:hypothetical protein
VSANSPVVVPVDVTARRKSLTSWRFGPRRGGPQKNRQTDPLPQQQTLSARRWTPAGKTNVRTERKSRKGRHGAPMQFPLSLPPRSDRPTIRPGDTDPRYRSSGRMDVLARRRKDGYTHRPAAKPEVRQN